MRFITQHVEVIQTLWVMSPTEFANKIFDIIKCALHCYTWQPHQTAFECKSQPCNLKVQRECQGECQVIQTPKAVTTRVLCVPGGVLTSHRAWLSDNTARWERLTI